MENQNEVVVPKTTKQKKSPVLTIVLIIFALAGIGFGAYGMFFNKTEETKCSGETGKSSTEIVEKEEDYTVYYSIVDKYIQTSWGLSGALDGNVHNEQFMLQTVLLGRVITSPESGAPIVNTNALKEEIKELFGVDYDLNEDEREKIEVLPKCMSLVKNQNGNYEFVGGCGSTTFPIYNIVKAEEKDSELRIEISLGFVDIPYGPPIILIANGEKIKEANFDENDDTGYETARKEIEDYFEANPDKTERYSLTFKKGDKYYYLDSSEKIN